MYRDKNVGFGKIGERGVMVFNAPFNNISVISWWSVLLVEVNITFQHFSRHLKIEMVFPNYLKSSSQSSSG